MTERFQSPRHLDVRVLAIEAASLQGSEAASSFERLAQSVLATPAPVAWSAQGELRAVAGSAAEIWVRLKAHTEVTVTCQRCLQPMQLLLEVDRHYQFVTSESEAERLDDVSDHEVLVLARQIDYLDLLEDELILALPIVPRHEVCPQPLVAGGVETYAAEPDETPHAFAALAALRKPPMSN